MNKLGVVHSGYDPIIPLGNRICLRFQLDDYQKGDFWNRSMADHDPWTKYVYLKKRSYYMQVLESIRSYPEEIFFVIDTRVRDFSKIEFMISDVIKVTRSLGYKKDIVISAINEPLEFINQAQIHALNKLLDYEISKHYKVYLAVGEMACDFTGYYKSYLDVDYGYDYISFHTDNNCSVSTLREFLKLFPISTRLINNEHYHYYGSEKKGYDDSEIIKHFKRYTNIMIDDSTIESIYVCMPFHSKTGGKYNFLGLNLVDNITGEVYQTKAWKMLKEYDVREVIKMYLKELGIGYRGLQVRVLQKVLNKVISADLVVDGIFGSKTEAQISIFNEHHNVKPYVICTHETWYELLQDINGEMIVKDLIDILRVIE